MFNAYRAIGILWFQVPFSMGHRISFGAYPKSPLLRKMIIFFDNCLLRRPKPHPLTSPARILPIKLNKQSSFELLRGPDTSLLGLERVITHLPEPRQLLIKQLVSQFKVGASEGNWTLMPGLASRCINRYTTPAFKLTIRTKNPQVTVWKYPGPGIPVVLLSGVQRGDRTHDFLLVGQALSRAELSGHIAHSFLTLKK